MSIRSRLSRSLTYAWVVLAAVWLWSCQPLLAQPHREDILFVGSSIFHRWTNLKEQMAPLPVFNRAIDGLQTTDLLRMVDSAVLAHTPRIIVYYCGSNDVDAGERAEAIADRFRQFVARVSARLPSTRVFFVSINKAPEKKNLWDVVDAANAAVKRYAEKSSNVGYIDVNPALFDSGGRPREELYLGDALHFRA